MQARSLRKKPARQSRSETAGKILDLAEMLIQTRGYSAFSYQDIADALGVTKASIHYHFESKTDLGIAVIERYSNAFAAELARVSADTSTSALAMLDHYTKPFLAFAETPDRVCLCGAMAGEVLALPEPLRERVERFFKTHQQWLTDILKRGVARGEFELSAPPAKMARTIFGALQGALLVRRTTGDPSQLKDVVSAIKLQLTKGGRSRG